MEERLRRTMMFVPGNNAGMVKDAGIYGADSIMFDLEDSVSMSERMLPGCWFTKHCKPKTTATLN